MRQCRATPMPAAYSTARALTTGSAPGNPRHTGQTWVFGSAPNVVAHPQNIFVAVFSSTCVSRPRTGSYEATASSYGRTASRVSIAISGSLRQLGGPVQQRRAPAVEQRRLERRARGIQAVILGGRRKELDSGGQPVLGRQPARDRHPRHPGEVRRDGRHVVEVHGEWVV